MNHQSSRSHGFFEIIGEEEAKIIFIDLAGHEPSMKSKVSKTPGRRSVSETGRNNPNIASSKSDFVNESLLDIGMVFTNLCNPVSKYVYAGTSNKPILLPLVDALSHRQKLKFLLTITPTTTCANESQSTIRNLDTFVNIKVAQIEEVRL